MLKDKKIFITGGAGFIANKIIEQYADTNEIIVYDNFSRDTLSSSPFSDHKNITIVKGDVLDKEKLFLSMRDSTHVIHAAGIAGIDTVVKNPVKTMTVNMIGTANALEGASNLMHLERFIDFSTSEVFGPSSFKSTENSATISGSAGEARWTYAVSKLAGEHLALAYYKNYNLPAVIVRPFNVYGPGQTGEGAMKIFIQKALKNETIQIDGDGAQIRAWCYVDDFVRGICKCMEHPDAVGEAFNIGNSRAVITILGLAQLVCRVLESNSKIEFIPALSADIQIRVPSIEKSRDILDFVSEIDLEEGVQKTANYLKLITGPQK